MDKLTFYLCVIGTLLIVLVAGLAWQQNKILIDIEAINKSIVLDTVDIGLDSIENVDIEGLDE